MKQLEIVPDSTLDVFKAETRNSFDQEVVQKICHKIETFLRLDYHSNLQLEKYNPFHSNKVYYTMKALAKLESMDFFGKKVLIKGEVNFFSNVCQIFIGNRSICSIFVFLFFFRFECLLIKKNSVQPIPRKKN